MDNSNPLGSPTPHRVPSRARVAIRARRLARAPPRRDRPSDRARSTIQKYTRARAPHSRAIPSRRRRPSPRRPRAARARAGLPIRARAVFVVVARDANATRDARDEDIDDVVVTIDIDIDISSRARVHRRRRASRTHARGEQFLRFPRLRVVGGRAWVRGGGLNHRSGLKESNLPSAVSTRRVGTPGAIVTSDDRSNEGLHRITRRDATRSSPSTDRPIESSRSSRSSPSSPSVGRSVAARDD